jgi:hypothetical protein
MKRELERRQYTLVLMKKQTTSPSDEKSVEKILKDSNMSDT